jgi:hypothetical protein
VDDKTGLQVRSVVGFVPFWRVSVKVQTTLFVAATLGPYWAMMTQMTLSHCSGFEFSSIAEFCCVRLLLMEFVSN